MLRSVSEATFRPRLKDDTTQKRRDIDLRKLMADLELREEVLFVTIDEFGPLNTGANVTGFGDNFAEILLSTTADVVPREKSQRGHQG